MKGKLVILSLVLGTLTAVVPAAEAKTSAPLNNAASAAIVAPQIRVRIGRQRRHNRRMRTVTTTRITRVGRMRYRETIRTTYWPNGRTTSRVISRVRIYGRG